MDEIDDAVGRPQISKNFAPPAFVLQSPNPVNDGTSYRVVAWPSESLNDADRALVTNPADNTSSPFGWQDTDGVAGPEFTITRGNNVHAYMDQDSDNVPDFNSSPDAGPSLKFDFPLDPTEHAQTYRDAAVTNMFYGANILHDISYHYGFDEASGNFQSNNYGRGGTGGDYVRAEAADGNGTNNANFNPPVNDGGTPREQMYLWPGTQFGLPDQVVVDGGATFAANYARNTPAATNAGIRRARSSTPAAPAAPPPPTRRRCPRAAGSPSPTAAPPPRSAPTCSVSRSPRRSAPRPSSSPTTRPARRRP